MTENNSGSLSEKFKQKAIEELREDDLRKQQALAQFREWILKQGHIKNCRTGLLLIKRIVNSIRHCLYFLCTKTCLYTYEHVK